MVKREEGEQLRINEGATESPQLRRKSTEKENCEVWGSILGPSGDMLGALTTQLTSLTALFFLLFLFLFCAMCVA